MSYPPSTQPIFRSFWMGGFESSCHINGRRKRLDLIRTTQHDLQAGPDYQLLHSVGILTARDAMRWPLIDHGGDFDFSSLIPMAEAARDQGVQVIWDLCHFGWPEDIDVFSGRFIERFAAYCEAAARAIAAIDPSPPVYVPVNEMSFLSWAAGDVGWIFPHVHGRGFELKCQLVRAAIAGMDAVRKVDPRARFAHVEPVIHIVPRRGEIDRDVWGHRNAQFQALDMLAGRLCPELGGHPRYVDIVGVNFYHDNQWELDGAKLSWADEPRDERWMPLHSLLGEVWYRYRRPLFVSETGHFGCGRARWIEEVAAEIYQAHAHGIPVEGACLYPIIDRPDWENPERWHNVGLWDLSADHSGHLWRVPEPASLKAFQRAQQKVGRHSRSAPIGVGGAQFAAHELYADLASGTG